MTTSLTRRLLGGVLAVLLVIGVAGAQTVSTDTPKIAALRVTANAGDAPSQRTGIISPCPVLPFANWHVLLQMRRY